MWTYGTGKPGANGIPKLSAKTTPFLGTTGTLQLGNGLPGAVPYVILGLQIAAIPFDAGTLFVAPLVVTPLVPWSPAGNLDLPIALPSDPALVDVNVYFQYLFVDPAAAGFNHTAQSNGLRWRLGF